VNTNDYICDGTTSYVKQQRYTGTTSSNINTATSEYKKGAKIQDNDPRCGSYETRWVLGTGYTCVDGDKWSIEEEERKAQGGTWQKTGNTRLKTMVEADSSFCEETIEYKWVLTDKWQCQGTKFKAIYTGGTTYYLICDGNRMLTYDDTIPTGYTASAMTSAEIGDCITSIGEYAFMECYSLTSVTIPDSVTSIGNDAFSYCTGLTSVTIPDSVTSIGESAFFECYELENIELPNGITSISNYTFEHCYSLTDVIIPNNVTSIGLAAFYDCSGITSVSIGNSVTSIGEGAFMWCKSLTDIEIPTSVTSIGQSAFENCRSLTSVTISDSVTSIGHQAFYYCNALTSITCLATTPPTIGDGVFNLTNNCPIYVPASSVNAYKTANVWSSYADRIQAIP
jgi:hypothetical protein